MAEPTKLRRRAFADFCQSCLDEQKCHEAGKCLFDAGYAKDLNDPAPVVPIGRKPSG